MRNLKARDLKTIAWTVAVVALILASARPALAFVSHGGGEHHGAAVVHGRVFVGPVFLGSAFGPAYYPPPVIYPAPVVVQQPAPVCAGRAVERVPVLLPGQPHVLPVHATVPERLAAGRAVARTHRARTSLGTG
jgi:hypothetical protein